MDTIHNCFLHPSYLAEAVNDTCENIKSHAHIVDCSSISQENTDLVKDGVEGILQGREQNAMSNIRAMIILDTTNDSNKHDINFRDSVRLLHEHC